MWSKGQRLASDYHRETFVASPFKNLIHKVRGKPYMNMHLDWVSI